MCKCSMEAMQVHIAAAMATVGWLQAVNSVTCNRMETGHMCQRNAVSEGSLN